MAANFLGGAGCRRFGLWGVIAMFRQQKQM